VIALGMSYAPRTDPLALAGEGRSGGSRSMRRASDYHDVIKGRLKELGALAGGEAPGADVKVFVDTAPVMEKPLAEAAGLGWQGKHTNLVSRSHGSWLFLGSIYTTPTWRPTSRSARPLRLVPRLPDACPTDAFPAPYRLDARRCISYLTIEHKGPIPHEFREGIGNRIYGCDDCLAACPWNKFAHAAQANLAFVPRAELTAPALADLLALDDAGFREVFSGSPIKRIGRDRMVRNCLIAAGNSGSAALVEPVRALLGDADEAVREAAGWALAKLEPLP
jgi:epoxyqueuosine reductase